MSVRISFVVPTRDSSATLERCLSSIRAQSYRDFEILVIDNYSTDLTPEIGERLADEFVQAGPERSAQRNLGAMRASGQIIAFIDSDMVLAPDVAAEAADVLGSDPALDGLVIPERSAGVGFWAQCRSLEKQLYVGDPDIEAARIFRRSTFERVGGYDESIHGGGEEWDLPERIIACGGRLGRVPAYATHLEGRLKLLPTLRKKVYYGKTIGLYARKHPAGIRRKVFRRTFLRQRRLLIEHPFRTTGLLLLKATEGGALGLGALSSLIRRTMQDEELVPTPARRHER
jgi:glycosyltransferase involved in cell wall biosynthesis